MVLPPCSDVPKSSAHLSTCGLATWLCYQVQAQSWRKQKATEGFIQSNDIGAHFGKIATVMEWEHGSEWDGTGDKGVIWRCFITLVRQSQDPNEVRSIVKSTGVHELFWNNDGKKTTSGRKHLEAGERDPQLCPHSITGLRRPAGLSL